MPGRADRAPGRAGRAPGRTGRAGKAAGARFLRHIVSRIGD